MSFSLLKPAKSGFFPVFIRMTGVIEGIYELYLRSIDEHDPKVLSMVLQSVKELRAQSNTAVHQLFLELGRNFITPLDREDMYTLGSALDSIADYLETLARQRLNYGLYELPADSTRITGMLRQAIDKLVLIVKGLGNKGNLDRFAEPNKQMKRVLDSCLGNADAAKRDVLNGTEDILYCIKMSDHYQTVITLLGKVRDAGNTIDNIIIKYS